MTAGAGRFDWRFRVRILIAVAFMAFNATSLGRLAAVRNAMISVLDVYAAAFACGIRVIRRLMAGEALQHLFRLGVLIGVMTILTLIGIFRLDMISMIEVLDNAPFSVLPPLIALFRIAQPDDACR